MTADHGDSLVRMSAESLVLQKPAVDCVPYCCRNGLPRCRRHQSRHLCIGRGCVQTWCRLCYERLGHMQLFTFSS
jgi:hypothetical protein